MALDQLPDDVDALKSLVADQLTRNEQLESRVVVLEEQLALALARRYAASSEKVSPDQIRLFDEAEVESESAPEGGGDVTVAAHRRIKRGRERLPDTLPRVDVIHDLSEAERVCPHDGAVLEQIGDVVSEQLSFFTPIEPFRFHLMEPMRFHLMEPPVPPKYSSHLMSLGFPATAASLVN